MLTVENDKKDAYTQPLSIDTKGFEKEDLLANISDLHIFHRLFAKGRWAPVARLTRAMLDHLADTCGTLILNGDIFELTFSQEKKTGNIRNAALKFMRDFCARHPECEVYLGIGNHDGVTQFVNDLHAFETNPYIEKKRKKLSIIKDRECLQSEPDLGLRGNDVEGPKNLHVYSTMLQIGNLGWWHGDNQERAFNGERKTYSQKHAIYMRPTGRVVTPNSQDWVQNYLMNPMTDPVKMAERIVKRWRQSAKKEEEKSLQAPISYRMTEEMMSRAQRRAEADAAEHEKPLAEIGSYCQSPLSDMPEINILSYGHVHHPSAVFLPGFTVVNSGSILNSRVKDDYLEKCRLAPEQPEPMIEFSDLQNIDCALIFGRGPDGQWRLSRDSYDMLAAKQSVFDLSTLAAENEEKIGKIERLKKSCFGKKETYAPASR